MKKLLSFISISFTSVVAWLAAARLAFAQDPDFEYVRGLGEETGSVITILLVLVVSFALLFFFYGLAKFILNAGDESARQEGRNIMFWGIIALTVIVAVWGLVQVVATLFGVDNADDTSEVPSVEGLENL